MKKNNFGENVIQNLSDIGENLIQEIDLLGNIEINYFEMI